MRNSYHTKKKPCMNKSIWVFVSLIASVRGGRQTLSSLRGGENPNPNEDLRTITYKNCLSDVSNFLLQAGWCDYEYLDGLTGDNDCNTLIVNLNQKAGYSIQHLQG